MPDKFRQLRSNLKSTFFTRPLPPKAIASLVASLILIILIIIGIIIFLDVQETRRLDATSVVVKPDTNISYGEPAKVSDFLAQLNGTLVTDTEINTTQLGPQTVSFEYINAQNRQRPASLTVTVVDTTAPQIFGSTSYTVPINYSGDLTNLMLSGDGLDPEPSREITGNYDLTQAGSYPLTYAITDASGNRTTKSFTLHVTDPPASPTPPYASPKLPLANVIRDYKTAQTKIGIDVSGWQGKIDWTAVKAAGVEFAFIRLGYQTEFGGEYHLDRYFHANIQAANTLQLPVGVYFYSYADSHSTVDAQVAWIKDQIKDYYVELGVAFDWENWREFNQANLSFRSLNQLATQFITSFESAGYRSLLYSSKNYLDLIWEPNNHPVWLAQYYHQPTYAGDFQIWQMSDSGQVPGINGNVDLDIMYDTK